MADIITYPENGIQYDADDASGYLATRLSGVYSADEDFAVTANGDLTVTVSAGQAWVHPARFWGRSIIMEQPETVTLTAADAVRSRIDRLVLRYDAAAKKTSLTVLTGTPDSASPAPPEISRTALVYDLSLATITRKAGSSAITAADITDTRADEDVCGVMRDGVTGIPTAQLQAQALSIMTQLSTELHTKLAALDAAIASVESGSFYTKAEADAKFGTPYTLPAATTTTLGGVKAGRGLTVSADGTLEVTAENLDTVLGFRLAEKLRRLERMMDMDGKLVYTGAGVAGKVATSLTVPETADYIVVKMMAPAALESGSSAVAVGTAADYGSTRIVRGGTAVAMVGGLSYNFGGGVMCSGAAPVRMSFAADGTLNVDAVRTDTANNYKYPFNVEGYQYV